MRSINRPFLAALGGLALVLAACSSSGGASSAPTAAPSAAAPSAAAGGGGAVALATGSGAVGAYLTGADGKTLYIFTPDAGTGKSTCVDKCAATWPPVIVTGAAPAAPSGVTGALTTFARPDGSMQVAINGWPLYYFAADTKAGDTTGQGVGGKWFVAPLDGVLPSAAPSSALGY